MARARVAMPDRLAATRAATRFFQESNFTKCGFWRECFECMRPRRVVRHSPGGHPLVVLCSPGRGESVAVVEGAASRPRFERRLGELDHEGRDAEIVEAGTAWELGDFPGSHVGGFEAEDADARDSCGHAGKCDRPGGVCQSRLYQGGSGGGGDGLAAAAGWSFEQRRGTRHPHAATIEGGSGGRGGPHRRRRRVSRRRAWDGAELKAGRPRRARSRLACFRWSRSA